ncbi:MAG: SMI1/KNR4 family protein [Lachnospiraceae bacterium]|nr:SMI1/KNR4 family protein [Lachnospiraceae bacterium]
MNIAQEYVEGLKEAYHENELGEEWDTFEAVMHGADRADLEKLRKLYPDIPESLIQLLKIVDGTYWREYGGREYGIYFLGSDIEEYPYYLLSAEQMTDTEDFDWIKDYIDRKYADDVEIDEEITDDSEKMCWLHFSDCMNNGGTSQLFIDFSPAPKGTKGQVVRFLHDPDNLAVIAESFDEYLRMLMEDEYWFIHNDE